MIHPSPHDTDDPTNSSDLDDDEQVELEPWIGLEDEEYGEYGDGQPSSCLPGARDMARIFTHDMFEGG